MQFGRFLTILSEIEAHPLPGIEAQRKMIPETRIIPTTDYVKRSNPSQAGVLALFYPDSNQDARFLLTLRASYSGTHSAQVSFPGGKYEAGDRDLAGTALRETSEETGVNPESILIKKSMTETYIPPSNFLVSPFVGFTESRPQFRPNHEVKEIIEVKVADLLDDKSTGVKNLSTSYLKNVDVPCYYLEDHMVWGATAMMLSEIKELIKLGFH
jgi:8-oxo-dGTP pyrophosphatase MutT (NUDIX family)